MEKKKSLLTHPLVVMVLASLCCLLWGSAIPFINLGYKYFAIDGSDTASQILFAGCRFFLAGGLTILFESLRQKKAALPKKENWGNVVKLCLAQTVGQYVFFYIGVAHTSSVKGSILLGLNAFVTILIACFLFRTERMNALKWIGGLLGVLGVFMVNWNGEKLDLGFTLNGEVFLIISMVAGACSSGLIKRYAQKDSPVVMSGWQFMVGGAAMAVCGFLMGARLHPVSWLGPAVLLYLAGLSAVAYTIWALLLKVNPISRVAVYTFLQPVFGVLLSLLLVDTASTVPLLRYGAALVLVCLSIVVVGRGQQKDL